MAKFSRYDKFTNNGSMKLVPFVEIPVKTTDMYTNYIQGISRLDLISYQYYGDPNYGWLILQANPELGSYEYKIPDGTLLRIPFPLSSTLSTYQTDIDTYNKLYETEEVNG